MRNWRELTRTEVEEIAALYPCTTNREICRRYDVSRETLIQRLAQPGGWKKDRTKVLIGNRRGKTISDRDLKWFIAHYQHTRNAEIMERLGIGEAQLHRLARKYGLKKTTRFMKRMQRETTAVAYEACRTYGIYEQTAIEMSRKMRERVERGETVGFRKGVSCAQRFGKKKWRQMRERANAKRNETIRRDRLRIKWGLPQISRMKLVTAGSRAAQYRHILKKRGYIVGRGSVHVYYDDSTRRNLKNEATAVRHGLIIEKYSA